MYQLENLDSENQHEHSSQRDLLLKIDRQVSFWQYPEKNLTELVSQDFEDSLMIKESLDLQPEEKPRSRTIWTSLTPPHAKVTKTNQILTTPWLKLSQRDAQWEGRDEEGVREAGQAHCDRPGRDHRHGEQTGRDHQERH